jgi:hypothetical protein
VTSDRKNAKSVPFRRSYWVIPGELLAGYYPGSEKREEARRKITALVEHGIRHVINLMEANEVDKNGRPFLPYEELLAEIGRSFGCSIAFSRMPIKDLGIPSAVEMEEILDLIDRSLEQNRPVYVHCWGGRGRTGTVVGCYLARHGYALGPKLLDLIDELRRGAEDFREPSPETGVQRNMVLEWGRRQ